MIYGSLHLHTPNYQAEIYAFGKRLNEEFRKDLLQQAFTHRSYIIQEEMKQREVGIEDPKLDLQDNRELSKRGEKLMSAYLKQHLRVALPRFPEEGICGVLDYLMKDTTLAHVSKNIGTSDIILCSDFPVEETTLAETLKAIIGALAESSGEDRAKEFVRDFVLTQLAGRDVNEFWEPEEPMKMLTSILNREGKAEPEPRLINESYGESISIAVKMAAHDALKRLFLTTENMKPIPFTMDVGEVSSLKTNHNVSVHDWSSEKVKNVVHI
ncbi:39S ribosomal protein L44 [Blattella germanica]|nr:39S ribosomal protein L44 [Blattella germanica]